MSNNDPIISQADDMPEPVILASNDDIMPSAPDKIVGVQTMIMFDRPKKIAFWPIKMPESGLKADVVIVDEEIKDSQELRAVIDEASDKLAKKIEKEFLEPPSVPFAANKCIEQTIRHQARQCGKTELIRSKIRESEFFKAVDPDAAYFGAVPSNPAEFDRWVDAITNLVLCLSVSERIDAMKRLKSYHPVAHGLATRKLESPRYKFHDPFGTWSWAMQGTESVAEAAIKKEHKPNMEVFHRAEDAARYAGYGNSGYRDWEAAHAAMTKGSLDPRAKFLVNGKLAQLLDWELHKPISIAYQLSKLKSHPAYTLLFTYACSKCEKIETLVAVPTMFLCEIYQCCQCKSLLKMPEAIAYDSRRSFCRMMEDMRMFDAGWGMKSTFAAEMSKWADEAKIKPRAESSSPFAHMVDNVRKKGIADGQAAAALAPDSPISVDAVDQGK